MRANESVIEQINKKTDWFRNENKLLSLWVNHWLIYSTDLFKNTDSFGNKIGDKNVFMNKSIQKNLSKKMMTGFLFLGELWWIFFK